MFASAGRSQSTTGHKLTTYRGHFSKQELMPMQGRLALATLAHPSRSEAEWVSPFWLIAEHSERSGSGMGAGLRRGAGLLPCKSHLLWGFCSARGRRAVPLPSVSDHEAPCVPRRRQGIRTSLRIGRQDESCSPYPGIPPSTPSSFGASPLLVSLCPLLALSRSLFRAMTLHRAHHVSRSLRQI